MTYFGIHYNGPEKWVGKRDMVQQNPELLTSWKEIAAYLGKGVRTVQRWEVLLGLPVRRPNRTNRSIVHVSRSELDRWLAEQWSSNRQRDHIAEATRNQLGHGADWKESQELVKQHKALLAEIEARLLRLNEQCAKLCQSLQQSRRIRPERAQEQDEFSCFEVHNFKNSGPPAV